MDEEQIKVLVTAAQHAGIPLNKLKALNPFAQQGDVARSMQMAVAATNPAQAAAWRVEAGHSKSLEAAAVQAGIMPMTNAVHQELMDTDSDYVTGVAESQARREAELLEKLNQGADQMRQLREKQQRQFQQSAGTAETGPHNRDFLRRMGTADLRNIPARRLIK